MDVPMNDREQIDVIKKWWAEYGVFTIVVFAIVLGASYGWNYFKEKKIHYDEYASMLFEQTQYSLSQQQYGEFKTQADYLTKEFKHAPYAQLASFAVASRLISENKFDEAQKKLHEVVLNSKEPAIRQIARIREARILLSLKKYDDAMNLLKKVDQASYLPMIEEVRGDIYVAKENYAQARESYKTALRGNASEETNRTLLQMKYEQIADHYNEVV